MNVAPALVALESRWRTAVAGFSPPVEVFSGPDATREYAARSVTLAAAFNDDQDAVSYSREERGAGSRVTEMADVACSVYVGTGDLDMAVLRTETGAILNALEASLMADRTLGGTCALARIASTQWMQGVNEQGAGVAVGIIVHLRWLP